MLLSFIMDTKYLMFSRNVICILVLKLRQLVIESDALVLVAIRFTERWFYVTETWVIYYFPSLSALLTRASFFVSALTQHLLSWDIISIVWCLCSILLRFFLIKCFITLFLLWYKYSVSHDQRLHMHIICKVFSLVFHDV